MPRRREFGAARRAKLDKMRGVGKELEGDLEKHIGDQLKKFREGLEAFASKHKKKINSDPSFRQHFQRLCAKVGVDPLSSSKGFWGSILGMGDFYYELGECVVSHKFVQCIC